MRRFLAIGVLALCAVTTGEFLRAYSLVGVTWGTNTVRYYVNPRSKWVSENAAISAVQTAAATWNASAANIELVYSGTTTGTTVGMNYKSEIMFRDATSGSSAGSGYYWYDGTGKIVDGDVVVWEGGYQFFAGSGCYNGVYIENLVAHELGHTLGLAHSGVGIATMYSTMQGWCDRSWLTLDADDIAGLEKAYPPLSGGGGGGTVTNTAPSVSISSPTSNASYPSTSAITFSATASDSQDGTISSNLNWTSNLLGTIGSGPSFSRTLTAGTHLITAVVTDSGGMVGSRQVTISVTSEAAPAPPPPPPPSGATLSVRAYKLRGLQTVDLTWTGVSGSSLADLYRNGVRFLTVANGGSWTDALNLKGAGSYSYRVCAAGTTTCTNTATATF
jgi:hypothetical protein